MPRTSRKLQHRRMTRLLPTSRMSCSSCCLLSMTPRPPHHRPTPSPRPPRTPLRSRTPSRHSAAPPLPRPPLPRDKTRSLPKLLGHGHLTRAGRSVTGPMLGGPTQSGTTSKCQRPVSKRAVQGVPQQRLVAANTKAGIDKALDMIIWVPGMQECRRSGAGRSGLSPPMTGLLGMALVGTRFQLPLEAILAMLGKQQVPAMGPTHLKAGDQGGHPPKLPHHGVGMPLLHGKAQLPRDCLHQLQEEHQHLSAVLPPQELIAVILVGARGRQTPEHLPEPQHLTEVQQHQQLASLLGDKGLCPPPVERGPR